MRRILGRRLEIGRRLRTDLPHRRHGFDGVPAEALSPESITASVPSSTALKTSLASARVGRLECSMLLSIWVAVITGRASGCRAR